MRLLTCARLVLAVALGAEAVAQAPQAKPTPPVALTWDFLISKNYLPYHQLKADDFPINDHPDLKFGFFAKSFIQPSFRYVVSTSPGGYVYIHIIDWKIYSGLNKSESWRRSSVRDVKQAVAYAQMGLDLNEIYARKLGALQSADLPVGQGPAFNQAYADLAGRVTGLVQETMAHAENEREKIADETDNGRNQKKVREVAATIRKQLLALATPTPTPITPTVSPTTAVASPSAAASPR